MRKVTIAGLVGIALGGLLGFLSKSFPRKVTGVTERTMKHLDRVEAAVQQTKPLLGARKYPANLRTVLIGGLVTQVIEHHEAMLLLIRHAKYGSAFALARSIFESVFRGLWFQLCATDTELQYFEQNDELPHDSSGERMNMPKMATAIDAATTHDPAIRITFSPT
jgi:hypothetical protein